MNADKLPLVSIAVIAYNSSDTISETLESAFAQTYVNVELIVSDDGSKDNTLKIVRMWMNAHKNRFSRVAIIASKSNRGTSVNYNRAVDACKGEWVFCVDADDLLLPNAIDTYLSFIEKNPSSHFIFGKVIPFGTYKVSKDFLKQYVDYSFFNLSAKAQYDYLICQRNCLCSASFIFHLPMYKKLGIKHDERIPIIEDWPKWINITKAGTHLDFMDDDVVKYRIHASSSGSQTSSPLFLKSFALVYLYYCYEYRMKNGNKRNEILNYLRAKSLTSNKQVYTFFRRIYVAIDMLYSNIFHKTPAKSIIRLK